MKIVDELPTLSTTLFFETVYYPVFDSEMICTHVLYTSRDITARTKAEEALQESEEKFRAIFDNAPILIDAFDENGKCVLWNKHCEEVFGWTIDEINAHNDPISLFYPDQKICEAIVMKVKSENFFTS